MTIKGWKRRIFGPFQEKIKGGENLRFFLEIMIFSEENMHFKLKNH